MSNIKTVLITGGLSGTGESITKAFIEQGYHVFIGYNSAAGKKDAFERSLPDGPYEMIKCDISDPAQADGMIEYAVAKKGSLDILINNAGIHDDSLIVKMNAAQWQRVIDVNLNGTFFCCSGYIDRMQGRGGRIVNISSVIGASGGVGVANYSASKAGITALTKCITRESRKHGIPAFNIVLGYMDRGMTADIPEKVLDKIKEGIPQGKLGSSADLAKLILFLGTPAADYMAGHEIYFDGGYSL